MLSYFHAGYSLISDLAFITSLGILFSCFIGFPVVVVVVAIITMVAIMEMNATIVVIMVMNATIVVIGGKLIGVNFNLFCRRDLGRKELQPLSLISIVTIVVIIIITCCWLLPN
jgi:hypothetical protein